MNRMSSLPIVQYCSAAGKLESGSGRAAHISKALHAIAAGEDPTPALSKLTPEEVEEVDSLHTPAPLLYGERELLWKDAHREVELCVNAPMGVLEPCGKEEALSVGHADGVWVLNNLVIAADIKLSHFTAGPDSLQLHAYGVAAALKHGKEKYMCAIWSAKGGTWNVGPTHSIHDKEAELIAAMRNTDGEFAPGAHCSDCYSRWNCPEHLLPMQNPTQALAPFCEPGPIEPAQAAEALQLYEALKSLQKVLKRNLEDYAEQTGGVSDGNGKVWRKVTGKKDRKVFDSKAFRSDHPDLYDEYCEEKPPKSMGYRWVKEQPK